mmetsp:Transcript_4473/g.5188  ORF Transcript_4473/g.5188 Transcript_4473/m.5188 type:complete len:349 (-) Transcript_4473:95-1141(-)
MTMALLNVRAFLPTPRNIRCLHSTRASLQRPNLVIAQPGKNREVAKKIVEARRKADTAAGKTRSYEAREERKNALFFGTVAALGVTGGFLGFTEQGNKIWQEQFRAKDGLFGLPYNFLADNISELMKPFADPDKDVLLPDMPPPPPGHVPLRTLVLDLEGTLCHSAWDSKYGWRTAKRPGVDKFLMRLAGMYEIVLFTSGPYMSDSPIVLQLDQYGCISHQLYRHSTVYMDNSHVKDISRLNRDLSKVIVVDDKPEEVRLQPENVVRIKSFTDVNAPDHALEQLLAFLEDLVIRDVPDVREEIKKYGDQDIGETFVKQLINQKRQQEEQRSKGLGGLIRKRAQQGVPK